MQPPDPSPLAIHKPQYFCFIMRARKISGRVHSLDYHPSKLLPISNARYFFTPSIKPTKIFLAQNASIRCN